MNKLPIKGFLIILFFASQFASFSQSKYTGINVIETSHGLYEVEVASKQKAENTLTQTMNLVSDRKLLLKTDTIVADIGKSFGVEFNVNTTNTVVVPLKFVWEFPKPMKNPTTGKIYKTSDMEQYAVTNSAMFHSYTLEYDYEFVEGLWTFKIYYNNIEVYRHSFWVMLPL